MKAAGGPQKLRFTVHSCSGEDTDYPVRELLYHSPQTRGWQSPRFCTYPQELVLRLERPCKIQQIQILAHEYKIPTKIEVFVGLAPGSGPDAAAAPGAAAANGSSGGAPGMRRLGYLSFDSNERSNHQARELKSVHVTVDAQLVRLVIHRCHVNKLNIYNQVGVIALNLIGEPLRPTPEGPAGFLETDGPVSHELPYYNRAAGELADLQLDMHVDSVTAVRIKELARAKEAAVAAEDYDEAKRLKAAIDRMKVVGGKIGQLEARKRLAVEREDYDLAKALKADIEKLRSAGEAAALSSPPGSGQAWANVPAGAAARQQQAEGGGGGAGSSSAGGFLSGDAAQLLQQRASDAAAAGAEGGGGGYADMYAADGADGLPDDEGAAAAGQQQLLHTYQAYEDRPAVAKAAFIGRLGSGASADGGGAAGGDAAALGDMDDEALIRADPSRVSAAAMFGSASGGSKKALHVSGGGGSRLSGGGPGSLLAAAGVAVGGGGAPAGARDEGCGAAPPQGWPSDLPAPEPLTPVSASDAGPVIDLAGEFVAAAFFSRAWQLRDAAAAWLADLVGSKQRLSGGGAEQREAARGLVRLSVKALKDKVPQVYSSNLSLLQALLAALAGSGSSRDVVQAVEAALPVLLERLSDNNSRLRDSARDALVALAQEPEGRGALRAQTALLCRLPRSQTAWRPVLAMLQLLQELLPLLGVAGAGGRSGDGGSGGGGFDVGEVMAYVGAAFSSANADVRGAALRVTVVAADAAGAVPVRRLLPQGMNPKMLEQVDAALGVDAGGVGTPAAAAAGTPGAAGSKAKSAAAAPRSTGKAAAAAGHPNRQPPAGGTPGGAPQRQQKQQQRPSPQQQQQQQQQRRQQHAGGAAAADAPQQQVLAGLDAEDPAPFAAELAAREQQYGPSHPAVAESCSNLAILYNQKGDYGAALPLYERALAIYESSYGPNHQEVAHTLTDLAVLHLEQGHDAVGRPLLERALVIQEAALGPDHPDVLAIRDVLSSE